MVEILGAVAAYLYGAIPFAFIAIRLLRHKDLRHEGTGNIGVTNAFKVGGTVAGVCSIGGEISKALVPLWMAHAVCPESHYAPLLFLFCALVGTSFSIFLKGRGGKGTTAAFWGLLVLSPYACLALLALWLVMLIIARDNPLIKKVPLLFIPTVIQIIEQDPVFTIFGALAAALMYLNSLNRKDDFIHYGILRQRRPHQSENQ
jgi:glycerol-3-phosphate acyltransferase PlsY